MLSAWIAVQPAPANLVLSLVATGRIDLSSPLRWRGHLRDEPAEFPWGISLNLGLDSVEFEGAGLDLAGGMRVTYSYMLARRRVAAPAILDNSQIGAFWAGREVLTPALAKLEAVARTRGIQVTHETRGQSFNLDGATGEVLWPAADTGDIETAAKNNDSVVIRLQFRNRIFFLPGDAETEAESAILSERANGSLVADVLKVGHHGSKNSTTSELLAAVHPKLAIISAGAENPYGHPSKELLERLDTA